MHIETGIKIRKDDTGNFRLCHAGIELPGRYPTFAVAKLAFSLPDETLLELEAKARTRTGENKGIVTYRDVGMELAKQGDIR